MAGNQEEAKLHKLCQNGNLKDITGFVDTMELTPLAEKLANKKGVFGYTPLHEAVARGKTKALGYLLDKVQDLPQAMTPINCKANSGYTPLHLAASSGHEECVRILIHKGADISIKDEYGKTPKQTAELSSKSRIVQLLRSEEIIKEVEQNDGKNLGELLKPGTDKLEPNCLNRALRAATINNNHLNIAKLIVRGPKNLEECLEISRTQQKAYSRACLLLIKAAISNNIAIVQTLFGTGEVMRGFPEIHKDEGLKDVRKAISSGKITTVVSLDLARRHKHHAVQEELLMQTDVHQRNRLVRWGGLGLIEVKAAWLRNIDWVKVLILARNGLKYLPDDMTALSQVTEIDLGHNELSDIPKGLLELPCLEKLNLCDNKLTRIPEVNEWSMYLKTLNLSHNQLYTLPNHIEAPALEELRIGNNKFRTIPDSICSLTNLTALELSNNPDILTLPPEMGRLKKMRNLELKNLKDLNDPPKSLHGDTLHCVRYLRMKLRGEKEFYRMKLMLVGNANRGKTTLVARLKGRSGRIDTVSTVGVSISEWNYSLAMLGRTFHFSIWDFGGQEEYYATHQCFLSQNSLYLLLFDLTHGENGVKEIVPWLNNIAVKAPDSKVIIVGTHLDQISEVERENLPALYQKVKQATAPYKARESKLQVCDIVAPVGLKNNIENVTALKQLIYKEAESYKIGEMVIMGRKIPSSYHTLDSKLQSIQKEVRHGTREPIMHATEFTAMVDQMSLADICDEEELQTAVLFLNDVGSLLHYDDRGHKLNELYFVDPRWLCDMMAKVVTIEQSNPYGKFGILHTKYFPIVYKDRRFPWEYYEQYIALLDRFEIALPLDNKRILIPSMLPEEKPEGLNFQNRDEKPLYSRHIVFAPVSTPPGLWSRLLSRIMHSITQVRYALDKSIPQTESPLSPPPPTELPVNESGASGMFNAIKGFLLPTVSRPIHHAQAQSPFIPPEQLPNFPKSLPLGSSHFEAERVQLKYWRTGLYYRDPEVMFCIESLASSGKSDEDGMLITATSNNVSIYIICQLIDIIDSLLKDWYPGIKGSSGIKHKVECPLCVEQGRTSPFMFDFKKCLVEILKNETTMECVYHKENPHINHTVELKDIVPDLLLVDVDPKFLLDFESITCSNVVLGEGAYGKVYKGTYKWKTDVSEAGRVVEVYRHKRVAIKKFNEEKTEKEKVRFLRSLIKEARFLCELHHPCLISLVGVCTHPNILTLVLEYAPRNSIKRAIMKKKISVERVTIFRIAAQVAAALRFLHSRRIIFRDLKADNVLLWTEDVGCLCHCKMTDFGIAQYLAPVGNMGRIGSPGFIAPEMFGSVYSHKVDVFSFGMFLYQLIARKDPFHDLLVCHRDSAVLAGERPKLQEVPEAHNSFHYLTQLMQSCWQEDPGKRPETDEIINTLCLSKMQVVKCVFPIRCNIKFTARQSIGIIKPPSQSQHSRHTDQEQHSELWVTGLATRSDTFGTEIIFIDNDSLAHHRSFLKEKYVECMVQCNDHVWMGTKTDTDGTLEVYKVKTHEHIHSIKLRGSPITCMCHSDSVYVGTIEGFVFRFTLTDVKSNTLPKYNQASMHMINAMIYIPAQDEQTPAVLWVSSGKMIHFLSPETMLPQGSVESSREANVGQLSCSPDYSKVWSVHLGSTTLTAWDTQSKSQLLEVNIEKHLESINRFDLKQDMAITAMSPAVDTVWVGIASGYILVLHENELLAWYRPYMDYVRFLTRIPSTNTDRCTIASEGKHFIDKPLIKKAASEPQVKKKRSTDNAGTVVFWEAHSVKITKQVKLIEENTPDLYDNQTKIQELTRLGEFKEFKEFKEESNDSDVASEPEEFLSNPTSSERTVSPVDSGDTSQFQVSSQSDGDGETHFWALSPTEEHFSGLTTDPPPPRTQNATCTWTEVAAPGPDGGATNQFQVSSQSDGESAHFWALSPTEEHFSGLSTDPPPPTQNATCTWTEVAAPAPHSSATWTAPTTFNGMEDSTAATNGDVSSDSDGQSAEALEENTNVELRGVVSNSPRTV